MATETSWAQEELGSAELGDKRLTRRLVKMAEQFEAQPFASIPQASGSWAATEAAYDFFDNDKVEFEAIVEAHRAATLKRMAEQSLVLALQDTAFLNYTSHRTTKGLGPIGTKAQQQKGLVLHATEAVTAEGVPLGLLDAQVWAREREEGESKAQRKRRPIEEKESYKWLKALRRSVEDLPEGVQLVNVCDRESDIYEFFDLAQQLRTKVVVRAAQDRKVEGASARLWATLHARPIVGTIQVHIPARDDQPARDARLAVRFAKVVLTPPQRPRQAGRKKLRRLRVWGILTTEISPPEGVTPISWMLLTNVPVHNFQDACERVAWYGQRWKVEVFFDLLENGCKVEDRRLRTAERLQRCIALYAVVAVRIQRMTFLARQEPEASCLLVLSTTEWQALYCYIHHTSHLPAQPPTLRQAMRWVAQLGGFLGRKGDGEPGIRTVWRGWQRLQDMVSMWHILRAES
jgi:hypothetical protein